MIPTVANLLATWRKDQDSEVVDWKGVADCLIPINGNLDGICT